MAESSNKGPRLNGTLVDWNDDRGFGFIEPGDGGGRVFCHVKAFEVRVRRPMAGDRVTYELSKGADGRTSAARVRPVGLEDASYQSNVGTKAKPEREQPVARRPGKSWALVFILFLVAAGASYFASDQSQLPTTSTETATDSKPTRSQDNDALGRAFEQQLSNAQVQGMGIVDRMLSDDSDGSRHQRFIVRLPSGQTVLISHNIDLAPRVSPLKVGDQVQFSGEYEWNSLGGVVHWTHHDPNGRHQAGWIKHNGQMFQ